MVAEKTFDCVLCGSCVVDLLVWPVPLTTPIGGGRLIPSDPIGVTTGGIVSNAGIAMTRLGMRVAAFSLVGDDEWAAVIRRRYAEEHVDAQRLLTLPGGSTSTTAVLIDPSGERSFAHCVGAPKQMHKALFMENMDLFAQSRMTLIGYYSLMPNLERDLAEVLAAIRETGCRTALDAAGDGGTMQPLDELLPHLDVVCAEPGGGQASDGQDRPRGDHRRVSRVRRAGRIGRQARGCRCVAEPACGRVREDRPGAAARTGCRHDRCGGQFLRRSADRLVARQVARAGRAIGGRGGRLLCDRRGATAGLRDYAETARLAGVVAD